METAVDVKNLVKVYEGKVKALDGVNLSVESGKIFALLGPNGAGKTTLMRILTTQIKPTSGEARVFGLDVTRDGNKIRKLVSYVPQEMSVWTDITGYENLLIYAKIYNIPSRRRRKMINDALDKMGLSKVAGNLAKTYSGGMIRRLETASSLLIQPKIMFLDEPTIGLDPSARSIVWKELMAFKKEYGTTVFFNTHYMDEADLYADELAIVNGGRIIVRGTAEQLKHSIGGERILISVQSDRIGEDALSRISKMNAVSRVTAENSELTIIANDAETTLPQVMEALRASGNSIKKASVSKPTLDDVFLKYAGTRLESSGRISEVRQIRRMIRRG